MPTPTFCTGFEHRTLKLGSAPIPNDRIWHAEATAGGTPAINTTEAKNGVACLEIPTGSGAASYKGRNIAGTPTIGVGSFYIKFKGGLPSADCRLFHFQPAAGSFGFLMFRTADSKLYASFGTSDGSTGFSVSADTWYLVDIKVNVGANPRTCDVTINGTGLGQASTGVATSTLSSWKIGRNTDTSTATGNILYDDIVISATSGDYPMGEHSVKVIRPDSDGTHSFTAGDFGYDDAGGDVATSATDVWTKLDDTSIDTISTTDSIRQKVVRATGYVEINLEAAPQSEDAWGLTVQSVYDALGTTAPTTPQCLLKLNDGGTLADCYTGTDFSNTAETYNSATFATAPSTGAWTQSKINALKLRWGYSADATPNILIHGVMVEIAYPPVTVTPEAFGPYYTMMALTGVGH